MPDKNQNIETVFKQFNKQIEPVLAKVLKTDVAANLYSLVQYPISTGGKRLRPVLTIVSCLALGGKLKDVLYPAAALELLHNYSLIVDDIIDNGLIRRGQPTVWVKYGQSITECLAIDYAASIFQAANQSPASQKIIGVLARSLKVLADGEVKDILFERQGRDKEPFVIKERPKKINQGDYLLMISQKTAALLQACCWVAGICAGASNKKMKALKDFGLNLGIAFQLQDDILDMFGEEKKFGKKIGKDIEEKKGGNIVLLYALEEASPKEKKMIQKIMSQKVVGQRDIENVLKIIQSTKALSRAFALKEHYVALAKSSLKFLPNNQWSKMLGELADFVAQRDK
jgi:geranylgeranyl diphosphate synthase type I